MARKCVYCKNEIPDKTVLDVCDRCGVGVWGQKMFQAIKDSMEDAKDKGNLDQGLITIERSDYRRAGSTKSF
jgi:hypothetical protein